MASVFLNYRREDSSGYTGRIFDRLVGTFGKEQIFRDVDRIEPGLDFTEVIDQSLKSCVALLVIIGPKWLELRNDEGELRLHEPIDYVRFEIEGALQRGVRVIPVLLPGMRQVPSEEDLPESIRALAKRHAFRLTEESWNAELDKLSGLLIKLGLKPLKKAKPPKAGGRSWISYGLMTLGVLSIVGMVAQLGGINDEVPLTPPVAVQTQVQPAPPPAPQTAIQSQPTTQPPVLTNTEPTLPANRSNVMRLQRGLAALGFYSGTIDGVLGPQTNAALLAYQQDEGDPADGRLTAPLLEEMDEVNARLGAVQSSLPPPPTISIAGLWYSNEGIPVKVVQNGNRFSSTVYDLLGNVAGTSEGSISGRNVSYSYRFYDGTSGTGTGTLQADDRHIDVTERESGATFPESNRLHRGHLPSSY